MADASVGNVGEREARALVEDGAVRLLDVRTPEEHRDLGHVPGSLLLPVDLMACGPAVLPEDDLPVLVYCEHGIRSLRAADLLARAGRTRVLNLEGGMSRWTGPRAFGPTPITGPSSWLLSNADLLHGRRVLDVACGRGRHALLLAAAGFEVRAVDRDADRLEWLRATAGRLGLRLEVEAVDLEQETTTLGRERFDVVLVVHYLHRPLFPALVEALAPGGVLLYETFTVAQAARGHPTNPAFLLQPGELHRLVRPLEVVRSREGEFDGRDVAGIVARRPERPGTPDARRITP